MARFEQRLITKEFLDDNPNAVFVFGDNLQRVGKGGAAKLRGHPQAIGFITKKAPTNETEAFFRPKEYVKLFFYQLDQLENLIKNNPSKIFYISKIGSGLANRYNIWEKLIRPNLINILESYDNIVFCWKK